ncbi:hypothetical protein MN608_06558 [Microdochium nivale]|nr:hypothetical protein MN608_06558 [Microdochium nivale]
MAPSAVQIDSALEHPPKNSRTQGMHSEIHTYVRTLDVNFERFFGTKPTRVDEAFTISLTEQSYLPKVDDPRADWAVIAAFNSFQAFQQG